MRLIILLCFFQLFQSHKTNADLNLNKLQENYKEIAFSVLKTKCNTCHATKKRTDIFTLENMDSLAPDIWKQVFVKKKMPKGRKIKLNPEEYLALRKWLDETSSVTKKK